MLICFCGDHTQICLACSSTFSCLEQTGLNQIRLTWTESRGGGFIYMNLIVCLCYSGILNPLFLLLGPVFVVLFFFMDLRIWILLLWLPKV